MKELRHVVGVEVMTEGPWPDFDPYGWTEEGLRSRRWRIRGTIVAVHDSHGLHYDVRHEDGSVGYYEHRELDPIETWSDKAREAAMSRVVATVEKRIADWKVTVECERCLSLVELTSEHVVFEDRIVGIASSVAGTRNVLVARFPCPTCEHASFVSDLFASPFLDLHRWQQRRKGL